jgi:hypothetical protein
MHTSPVAQHVAWLPHKSAEVQPIPPPVPLLLVAPPEAEVLVPLVPPVPVAAREVVFPAHAKGTTTIPRRRKIEARMVSRHQSVCVIASSGA